MNSYFQEQEPPPSTFNNNKRITVNSTQWVNQNKPFPQGCARYLVVGASNTGKTTLSVRIVNKLLGDTHDVRDQLVIVSPNFERDRQLKDLAQDAAARGKTVRVYFSFDRIGIEKFVEFMGVCAAQDVRSVVYIDDPVGVGSFVSYTNQQSPFNSFITGVKHYKADILFSTQAMHSLSRSGRKNIDVFIFLPDMVSRKELYEACPFVGTRQEFDRIMDRYAYEPFHALWVNIQFGRRGIYTIDANGKISPITRVP